MERYTSRVVSRLAFGDVRHHIEVTLHSHALLKAISPSVHLTNVIPQLKSLPIWLSPWKKEERVRHATERAWFVEMHDQVRGDFKAGAKVSSYMSAFMEMQDSAQIPDLEGAYVVGMVSLEGECSQSGSDSLLTDRVLCL